MGEYLQGDMGDRLKELRRNEGYSQNNVADKIGIDRSTYSKIETKKTATLSSDAIIKLSRLYNVSADYILGINDAPDRTNYEISQLGLSVEAARNLYSKKAETRVINELLVSDNFCKLTQLIKTYFSEEIAAFIIAHNDILDIGYQMVMNIGTKGRIPNDASVRQIKRELKALKINPRKTELHKINDQFTMVLNEIKDKLNKEVSEEIGERKILDKQEAARLGLEAAEMAQKKQLTEKEKNDIVVDYMKDMVSLYEDDITPEDRGMVDTIIENVAPILPKIGKQTNE